MLEIEPGGLMAEYRPALTPAGQTGLEAEIFLYDTLPGGAGFSAQLLDRSHDLFVKALGLMKTCPENCDASCYRCLRSFKNKFEHDLLDRHVGAELLEYPLTGEPAVFDRERLTNSTALLASDLLRQGQARLRFQLSDSSADPRDPSVIRGERHDGTKFMIALSGPLTPDLPADPAVNARYRDGDATILLVNELLVRGNLPAATREVLQKLSS
jgi:hypothetical protein